MNQVKAEGEAGVAILHYSEIDHLDVCSALGLYHALKAVSEAGSLCLVSDGIVLAL